MITISDQVIGFKGIDALEIGRTRDVSISRVPDGFTHPSGLADVHAKFLRVVASMAPPEFTTGVTFMRVLPPAATTANETHRDRDNESLNFVCFVAEGDSVQHEFFADWDFWEQHPKVVPNGHVIMFTKDLHRRPTRPAGVGTKVFLTASLYRGRDVVVSDAAEPYECHSGVMG